ncbi:MAG TPA: PASTA domain-containing protein [Pyrinomonadaceae bacterium]
MGLAKTGLSAMTMLGTVIVLGAAFLFGLATVVYMSLQGTEVKVPELVGKNQNEAKNELTNLGLQIKVRASRPSTDAPDTVLEQLPKPGETVKTGQLIFVVTSKPTAQPDETPATLQKSIDEDDSQTIEDMITDKPKKKANSNTNKKKPDTTRDVLGNTATSTTNSNTSESTDSNKKEPSADKTPEKKDTGKPETKPTPATKPTAAKPNATDRQRGQIRPR